MTSRSISFFPVSGQNVDVFDKCSTLFTGTRFNCVIYYSVASYNNLTQFYTSDRYPNQILSRKIGYNSSRNIGYNFDCESVQKVVFLILRIV